MSIILIEIWTKIIYSGLGKFYGVGRLGAGFGRGLENVFKL